MEQTRGEPLVCVLVPFTRWNTLVEGCVAGCLGLQYGNFLLCLLPDERETVPARVASDTRVRVIATGLPGISRKRNVAIAAHPEADFYACIDSDAAPTPGWLRNGIAAFGRAPDVGLVGGPDLSPDYPDDLGRRAVRNALSSWLVGGERTFMKTMSPGRFTDDLRTANCIIRREVIRDAGMFDETMPVSEDSAFCMQARRRGWRIWFDRQTVVRHHNRRLFLPFLGQKILAGYGVPPFLLKYPDTPLHGWVLRMAPLAMTLFLILGLAGSLFDARVLSAWAAGVVLYLVAVIAEAFRTSARWGDVPLTAVAIVIGNLGPGLGIVLAVAGVRIDVSTFCREQEGRSGAGGPP